MSEHSQLELNRRHDHIRELEAELSAVKARIGELEAFLKIALGGTAALSTAHRDPDVIRIEERTHNCSGFSNACDQDEGA